MPWSQAGGIRKGWSMEGDVVLWTGFGQIAQDGVVEMFQGKGVRQMEAHDGVEFTHFPGDFEEPMLKGIELRVHPRRAAQSDFCQGVHQDIGGRMEEETEVIGFVCR